MTIPRFPGSTYGWITGFLVFSSIQLPSNTLLFAIDSNCHKEDTSVILSESEESKPDTTQRYK